MPKSFTLAINGNRLKEGSEAKVREVFENAVSQLAELEEGGKPGGHLSIQDTTFSHEVLPPDEPALPVEAGTIPADGTPVEIGGQKVVPPGK